MRDQQNKTMSDKNAKSFFERLTGTIKVSDEEITEDETVKPKRVDFKDGAASSAAKDETSQDQEQAEAVSPKITATESGKSGSWLNEAQEGQLTIDVYQTENEIVIKSTVAGVKPEDLDIAITNDMVTIRGKREKDEEVAQQNFYYQECYWGAFSRSVILPLDVAAEKSEATMKNGILTIRLPKIEKEQTKKIKVKPLA